MWRSRPESNRDRRIRNPLLYPLELREQPCTWVTIAAGQKLDKGAVKSLELAPLAYLNELGSGPKPLNPEKRSAFGQERAKEKDREPGLHGAALLPQHVRFRPSAGIAKFPVRGADSSLAG